MLYLLGEYHRRLGDLQVSRRYFDEARSSPYKDDDGQMRAGMPYFVELIDERETLNKSEASAAAP